MAILNFTCRGERYKVREDGAMGYAKNTGFSEQWRFIGISRHHWRKGLDVPFSPNTPAEEFVGGLVWDIDHGTVRQWGGRYGGRLPRITKAHYEQTQGRE